MSKIIIVQGKRGSGKTFLARKLLSGFSRYIVFDNLHQFTNGVEVRKPNSLRRFLIENYKRNFKVIFRPEAKKHKNLIQLFDLVSSIVFECENVCYMVDEVDAYTSPHYVPEYFNGLIQRGRHRKISILATTRRHAETTRMLTAQADTLITFRQSEKNDLKTLKNYFENRTNEIRKLRQYEYLMYDVNTQKITKGGGYAK